MGIFLSVKTGFVLVNGVVILPHTPYRSTVPPARGMVQPLKLMVPLFTRRVTVQTPVRVQTQLLPMVMTALSLTASPPWALPTMLTVPVKLLPFVRVMFGGGGDGVRDDAALQGRGVRVAFRSVSH